MTGHEVFRNDDEDWKQDDEFILQDWDIVDDEAPTSLPDPETTDASQHDALAADEVLLLVDAMDGIDSDLAAPDSEEDWSEGVEDIAVQELSFEGGELEAAVSEFEIDWGTDQPTEETPPLVSPQEDSNWLGIPDGADFAGVGEESCEDSLTSPQGQDAPAANWTTPDSGGFDLLDDDSEELELVAEDGFEDLDTDHLPLERDRASWQASEDGFDDPGNRYEDSEEHQAVSRRQIWFAAILNSSHRRSLVVAAILMLVGLPVGYSIHSGWWANSPMPTVTEELGAVTSPAKQVAGIAKDGRAVARDVAVAAAAVPTTSPKALGAKSERPGPLSRMPVEPAPFRDYAAMPAYAWLGSVPSKPPAAHSVLVSEPDLQERGPDVLSARTKSDLLGALAGTASLAQIPNPSAVVPAERQVVMGGQAIARLANDSVFVGAVKKLSSSFVTLRTESGEITFARARLVSLRPVGEASGKLTKPSMVGSYVRLRNHNRLSGLIVETREESVVLQVQSNQVVVPRTEIDTVIYGDPESPVQIRESVEVDQDEWFWKLVEGGIERQGLPAHAGRGSASRGPGK